jgi:hypothetical protein
VVRFVLDAGIKDIRGVQRECRLLYEKDQKGPARVRFWSGPAPEGVEVVEITMVSYRNLMRKHGLSWKRKYETEEEREKARAASLSKYRKTTKYREARRALAQKSKGFAPLTERQIAFIKSSDMSWTGLARKFKISVRQVSEIRGEETNEQPEER